MSEQIAQLFISYSETKLQQMLSAVESCLSKLSDDQIWSRGAEHENSVGNLILHLSGNARQWIIAGIGGEKDMRKRDLEFLTKGGLSRDELLSRLRETVHGAISVIRGVTRERLTETINPQTGPVSVLEAIYQVVGHFQQHVGQIIFITKAHAPA